MIFKVISLLIVLVACLSPVTPVHAATAPSHMKELNIVILHGMGGTACSVQLLGDWITQRLPQFIPDFQKANPDTGIQLNILERCYPSYVDIDSWAKNVSESITEHFGDKRNLILVGHSMGGKTALYAVARNIGNLADKTVAVITINSPVKRLRDYYPAGGGSPLTYCRTGLLGTDAGVCDAVISYDSSMDAQWVAQNRAWLALISGEASPVSPQFDKGGVDPWPRDIDDGVVPISAQYTSDADVVYYGQYVHSALGSSDEAAQFLADKILGYIFGLPIECSVFTRSGTLRHNADWLLGKDTWNDLVGEVSFTGAIEHTNTSYTKWEQWDDTLKVTTPTHRGRAQLVQTSVPLLTKIKTARWLNPINLLDASLLVQTSAAPRMTVKVDWTITDWGLLPDTTSRSYYEVRITDGTPLSTITGIGWATSDAHDVRLNVSSEAHSPFRWFSAEWKVFQTEIRQRTIINNIPMLY